MTSATRIQRTPVLAFIGLMLYGVTGAFVVGSPNRVDTGLTENLVYVLNKLHTVGLPQFVNYHFVEFTANILMFFPLGVLLVVLFPYRYWWVVPILGFFASTMIELGQLLFLPGRVPTISDVIANTTGAVLGAVIAFLLRKFKRRKN